MFYAAKSQMSAKLRRRGCVIQDDLEKLRKAEYWDSNQRRRTSKVSSPRSNQNSKSTFYRICRHHHRKGKAMFFHFQNIWFLVSIWKCNSWSFRRDFECQTILSGNNFSRAKWQKNVKKISFFNQNWNTLGIVTF